jgi:hypothetical protein
LCSWADFRKAAGIDNSPVIDPSVITPSEPVWVVQVVGNYFSSAGHGRYLPGGVEVLHANKGHQVFAQTTGPEGASYWSDVPDDQAA